MSTLEELHADAVLLSEGTGMTYEQALDVVTFRDRGHGGSAQTLRDYWSRSTKHGKTSGIAWGTPGDFMQCVTRVSKFMTPEQAKGY